MLKPIGKQRTEKKRNGKKMLILHKNRQLQMLKDKLKPTLKLPKPLVLPRNRRNKLKPTLKLQKKRRSIEKLCEGEKLNKMKLTEECMNNRH